MFTHALGCVCEPPESQSTYPTKPPTRPAGQQYINTRFLLSLLSTQTTHTPSCAGVQRYQLLITSFLAGDRYSRVPTPPTFLCLLTTHQTKPPTPPKVQQYSLTPHIPSSVAMLTHALGCVCGPQESQPPYPINPPTPPAVVHLYCLV